MKKIFLLVALAVFCHAQSSVAQNSAKTYWVTGFEIPFQWAKIDINGDKGDGSMRFAPIINVQGLFNIDPGQAFGFITGLGVRNVGFIQNVAQEALKKKYRTYNLAVPLGIKVGNMASNFVYAGYEIEFPFTYKEKTYKNEVKEDVDVVWFSDRVPAFYHTIFVGVNLVKGFNIKFKYYFTNFHNKDFTEVNESGQETKPYENLNANVMFISLNINLFRDAKLYYSKSDFK